MAERKPIVYVNGRATQLPSGDTLFVGSLIKYGVATIDFGITPSNTASVLVSGLVGLTVANHKFAFIQADDTTVTNTPAAHKSIATWARLTCAYSSATAMLIHCDVLNILVSGEFKVHYSIT